MKFYNTSPINKWQHLDITERFYIEKMIALGYSNRAIARGSDRPHSTVNNEIKRGTFTQKKIVNGKEVYYTKYDAYVHGLFTKEEMVSAKTLYNYIDRKLINLDNFDLLLKLSRKATKQAPKKE